MSLDDRLDHAVSDLRDRLDQTPVPAFAPTTTHTRTRAAAMLIAAVVLIGATFSFLVATSNDSGESGVRVTSPNIDASDSAEPNPDIADPTFTARPTIAPSQAVAEATFEAEPTAAPTQGAGAPTVERTAYPDPTQLTDAQPGVFIAPLPGVSAWNANDSLLLLYQSGAKGSTHLVIDPNSGELVAEVAPDAPDIEQVYWHPLVPDELLWLRGAALVSHNVSTGREAVAYEFAGCDAVTTGRFPSPPSQGGVFAVMCSQGDSASLQVVDLVAQRVLHEIEMDASAAEQIETVVPSPSGEFIARTSSDSGAVAIIDLGTGDTYTVDLADPAFAWVVLPSGEETLAFASYDGDVPGTIVLSWPDGEPFAGLDVVVGPDAGDEYPPSGTEISATTGNPAAANSSARVVTTVRGPASADSELTGTVVVATIIGFDGDVLDVAVTTFEHDGSDINDYWSTNTVSVNSTGSRLVWASDQGNDHTNTFIVDLSD